MKILTLSLFLFFSQSLMARAVKIQISNMGNSQGQLALAIFNDNKAFPDNGEKVYLTKYIPIKKEKKATLEVELPDGDYAISVFLDANRNEKLDTNFLGMPKERFGFSRNPTIGFGPPKYEECAIKVNPELSIVKIKLIKFL